MYMRTTPMLHGFEPQTATFTPDDPRWRTAASREAHGLGQATPAQVTGGEFGKALASIEPPAVVTKLLKLSTTFMDMAGALDKRYVYLWHPTEMRHRRLTTSSNGVVTTGVFAGRRVLDVKSSPTGSWFEPYESPDNTGYYDVIWIDKPGQRDPGRWIEIIAHEVTHAFHVATRTSLPSGKLGDRVRSAIDEEIETRRIEALVVSEILNTTEGSRELKGFAPGTGSTDRFEVERDFFPSRSRRTYLEHFVLGELAQEAIRRERLDDDARKAKAAEVAGLPLKGWRSRAFASIYAKVLFRLRVIGFRWERLRTLHGSNAAAFERGKEIALQEHANAFFGGLVSYTPPPAPRRGTAVKPRAATPRP